jgi:tryptophan halogenase
MIKNITILGGGTAGWLTALYVNKTFPNVKITLIESTNIGILGAGEGSVPMLPNILQALDISLHSFKAHTNATYKLGVSFENWRGDGEKYIVPFSELKETGLNYKQIISNNYNSKIGLPDNKSTHLLTNLIANGYSLNDTILSGVLAYNKKLPFYKDNNKILQSSAFSFHFDARLTADYLKSIGEKRGINVIDGELESIVENKDGYITSLNLKDGTIVDSEFFFDCSGFKRLLIGKHYNTNWKSYTEHLSMNSAIPFFLPHDDKPIPQYTKAIAMKSGWLWQIPLKHRWGCGYIFNDAYTNEVEAKKEVEEYLGHEIEVRNLFKFNAGRYEKVWVKNCIAVGLSSGFTEPLEATSIMLQLMQLMDLDPISLIANTDSIRNEYNKTVSIYNDEIADFLYWHYVTDRNDTPFWKEYREKTIVPKRVQELMELWKYRTPNDADVKPKTYKSSFDIEHWIHVAIGNNSIDKSLFIKENEVLDLNKKLGMYTNEYINKMKKIFDTSINS